MPKNRIQFQLGLSLPKFLETYGTEPQCREALFQCNHRQTPVTCLTIFEATKLSLTVWFLGKFFITQSKDGISSLNLARSPRIWANAALRMKHKLQHVMKQHDDSKPLSECIQMDDVYWGGKRSGGKRGCGADGKTP